jgi:hypothetical protein
MMKNENKKIPESLADQRGFFNFVYSDYLVLPGYTFKASSRHFMAAFKSSMQMQ